MVIQSSLKLLARLLLLQDIMAGNYGHGQFQQNMGNVPHPIQTQNHPSAYSPQQYHQSPGAMSPTTPG